MGFDPTRKFEAMTLDKSAQNLNIPPSKALIRLFAVRGLIIVCASYHLEGGRAAPQQLPRLDPVKNRYD
jgi:hypothetical protein